MFDNGSQDCSDAMVSVLDPRLREPGWSPAVVIIVLFLRQESTLTVPLFTLVYKWVLTILSWIGIPSKEE